MIINCVICGNKKETNDVNAKYCSRKCMGISRKVTVKEHICKYCGSMFYNNRCVSNFCSTECYHMSRIGYHHSDVVKKKIGVGNKGKFVSKETREKQSAWQVGRKIPFEVVQKAANARRGLIPWNKGLTKETDDRVKCAAEKIQNAPSRKKQKDIHKCKFCGSETINRVFCSVNCRNNFGLTEEQKMHLSQVKIGSIPWNKGKHHSDETKKKISKAVSVANKGHYVSDETKTKIGTATKNSWKNSEYVYKVLSKSSARPNKPERMLNTILDELFPNCWLYTGDGRTVVCGLCPDFSKKDGSKVFIELYGDYWHRGQNPQDRIDKFENNGCRLLVIWEKELKDVVVLKNKLLAFSSIT